MNPRYRKVLAATSILVVATGAATYCLSPPPRLLANEIIHDFGSVTPNQDLSHSFRLNRSGVGSLKIVKAGTSCGCSAQLVEDSAGWSLEIKTRAEQALGEKRVSAWVETNEPSHRKSEYYLRFRVVSPLSMFPARPDFGEVEADRSSSSRLILNIGGSEGQGDPEVQILDQVEPPTVRLSRPAQGTIYELGLTDSAPVGPLTVRLRISFPEGWSAPVESPIRGMVVGDYAATPAEVESTWEHLDQNFVTSSRLITEGPAANLEFSVDRLFGDLENKTDIEVAVMGDQLEVRLKPGPRWARGGTCRGVIRLKAGDRAIIHVPVNIHLGV